MVNEDSDGRKRQASRQFEAEAILLMKDEVAGYGFLTLLRAMVAELDGVQAQSAVAAPDPEPVKEAPAPEPPKEKKPRGWYMKEKAEAARRMASIP